MQISVSMLEIKEEKLKDLLAPASGAQQALKIRGTEKTGRTYVNGLSKHAINVRLLPPLPTPLPPPLRTPLCWPLLCTPLPTAENPFVCTLNGTHATRVQDYETLEKLMDQGNKNRAVRAHKLNASSSRGHTIFGIYLQLELPQGRQAFTHGTVALTATAVPVFSTSRSRRLL